MLEYIRKFDMKTNDLAVLVGIHQLLQTKKEFSIDDIAREIGLDRKTVMRRIVKLRAENRLKVIPGAGSRPATYEILPTASKEIDCVKVLAEAYA